jgi:hypothetical protein
MDSHEPDFIVVGEMVALGPLRRDLAATYARWMNQLEVRRGLDLLGIATPEKPGEVSGGEPREGREARARSRRVQRLRGVPLQRLEQHIAQPEHVR